MEVVNGEQMEEVMEVGDVVKEVEAMVEVGQQNEVEEVKMQKDGEKTLLVKMEKNIKVVEKASKSGKAVLMEMNNGIKVAEEKMEQASKWMKTKKLVEMDNNNIEVVGYSQMEYNDVEIDINAKLGRDKDGRIGCTQIQNCLRSSCHKRTAQREEIHGANYSH